MVARLEAVRKHLDENGFDAVLVSQPENRLYLSGFTGTAGVLVVSADEAVLATDSRYYIQVEEEAPNFQLERVGYDLHAGLVPVLKRMGATRVGFEEEHVTVGERARLEGAFAPADVTLVPMGRFVDQLRAVKEPEEIDAIRRAVRITDEAYARTLEGLRAGMSEDQLAWEIRSRLHDLGVDELAFETIVAAGENSAKPHYRAGSAQIVTGEPLMIDMGARVDGYCGDLTRTVVLDEAAQDRFGEIHAVVLEAQRMALGAIRPGISGGEVDQVARQVIESAGHGEAFAHGLGHGVGLAVHEAPRLRQGSEDVLEPGMVFTVEPGIYVAGWGGVRMEDMVVVTETGVEVLTASSRDPIPRS